MTTASTRKSGASLLRNLLANGGGYVASIILTFLVAPVTIHNLGDARYGVWSLIAEMIGYYSLLDLGVGGAVTYFVARYSAREEHDHLHGTIASAFWALFMSGIVVVLVGVGMAAFFPLIFGNRGLDISEIRTVIIVMSCLIAVSLPMNTFNALLGGYRRFDVINGVEISSRILVAAATYWYMRRGYGLLTLASIQVVGRTLIWVWLFYWSKRVAGVLHLSPAFFEFARLKELWKYGLSNLVGQLALLIIYRLDLLVVGVFAGIQWVTYYSIGSALISSSSSAVSNITRVFTPQFSHLNAKDDQAGLRRLFFLGVRLSGLVSTIIAAGLAVFGSSFITLWVGPKYVSGPWQYRSDVIMMIMLAAQLPRFMQSISWQLLFGTGRNRFLMWLNLSEAAANLVLSLVLVHYYGPAGVAIGTLVPLIVSHWIVLPRYVLRSFNITFSSYVTQGIGRPIIVGLLMAAVGAALVWFHAPATWSVFATEVVTTGLFGLILAYFLGIQAGDRDAFLQRLGVKRDGLSPSVGA